MRENELDHIEPPSFPLGEPWRGRLQRLRSQARRAAPFAAGMLATLLALFLYDLLVPDPPQLTMREVNESVAQAMASATPPPAYSSLVYQAIRPSFVLIQTDILSATDELQDGDVVIPDEGALNEGAPNEELLSGLGSGVVINEAGDILTSLHVVENAQNILVTFADGTQSNAQIAVRQPENDIAVLHPDTRPALLIPAILGNPDAMRVGDEVFAVGNPFGLYSSMSAGVISGFDRSFHPPDGEQELEGLIQIDAAVNSGNSGGPLLNRSGHVVGIVVGIVNPTRQKVFVGIGFAVPIQVAAAGAGSPPY